MLLTRVSSMFGPRIYEILRRMSAQIEWILGQAFCDAYERALKLWYIFVGIRIVGFVKVEEVHGRLRNTREATKLTKPIRCQSNDPIRSDCDIKHL
jgi:hypothetical protein